MRTKYTRENVVAWSYGGGWQSVAIGVLIRKGVLPVPDLAAISDTGREVKSTWDYLHNVMQPYLDPVGVKIKIIPHDLASKDLYGHDGLTLMPCYTAEGRLPAFCSGEWKRDVIERWLRLQDVKTCEQWIGYSTDEARRMAKKPHRKWCTPRYPLIEKGISRKMIPAIIESAGLPMPSKSRCWMCPHQNNAEWREVQADPDMWAAAVDLEKQVNANDPKQAGLYLWQGRVPLEMADFSDELPLFPTRPCEGESCWT